MRLFFAFIFIFLTQIINAQIVNVESLRRVNDSSKWSGYSSLDFNITKNKNRIINIKNRTHVQYLYEKHLFLFVNDIDFKEANNSTLVSRGIQHARYNYRFKPRLAWEIFVQSQYDEISALDFRGLIGSGPRFKLTTSEKYKFYTGILSMYEFENIDSDIEEINHHDIRNSSYLSFSLFPQDKIAIVSTTYYQPLYKDFSDYRISVDTSVALTIFKNLAYKLSVTYLFDSKPPINIPNEQFKITNGLTYLFN